MRFVYSLCLYLLSPLVLLYFLWRGLRERVYWRGWPQRFGWGRRRPAGSLWVHAASVGEVQAAVPLIRSLQGAYPDRSVTLTCFTPTGVAQAARQFDESVDCRLLPLDLPGAMARFIKRQRPDLLVIIETEIWPNLLAACRKRAVPVVFANARMMPRSLRRYTRGPLASLFGQALAGVDRIAAASEDDAERFMTLGVPENRVEVTGNLKLDFQVDETVRRQGLAWRESWGGKRPVWVAGSTHEGEERRVLDAHQRLLKDFPELLMVLVPRHPARFHAVADLCRGQKLETARRSENHRVKHSTRVLLGDTLGELLDLYAAADVALVGGTLVRGIGGHNLLEPAALGVPVIVGPHQGGWAEVAGWLREAGALITCSSVDEIVEAMQEALRDDEGRRAAGLAARQAVEDRAGATARTQALIAEVLA